MIYRKVGRKEGARSETPQVGSCDGYYDGGGRRPRYGAGRLLVDLEHMERLVARLRIEATLS